MDLKDKIVIVTGSSDGLGKALAIRLAREGSQIILMARSEEKLKSVKEEITAAGGNADYVVCDMTRDDSIHSAVEQVKQRYGGVDVLVNNAGIWRPGKTEDLPPEIVHAIFETNAIGPILMTREVLPVLKSRGGGQILNVLSIAGVEEVVDYGVVYTATKHAMQGFTDCLKQECMPHNTRVMGFYPGGMATNIMAAAGITNVPAEQMAKTAMRPEDVAELLTFMLKEPGDVILDHVEMRKFMK